MCTEFTSPLPCVTPVLRNENGIYLQDGGVTLRESERAVLHVCAPLLLPHDSPMGQHRWGRGS